MGLKMKAGENCIAIIKKYEGCRLKAYRCAAGVLTIGYGHTSGVREGQEITQAQAEKYLAGDLEKFEGFVRKYSSRYQWNQNEFDALVSFAYNIGNIDKLTANGSRQRAEISEKILAYDKINGKPHSLLRKRREEERALFLLPTGKAPAEGVGTAAGAHATIKKGSQGKDVGLLQEYLAKRGYYTGAVDQSFGSLMERAVKLYQYDVGLVADGVAGAKTWGKVDEDPETGMEVFSSAKDGHKKISANFTVKEFRCKDGSDKIIIDTGFVAGKLQKIRSHFGRKVAINSGYRTADYNKRVNGASSSYHMYGRAFDIAVEGHTPLEVAQYAQTLGINGIIQYNGFVHVDSRETKYWARNDNGKVTIKNSF